MVGCIKVSDYLWFFLSSSPAPTLKYYTYQEEDIQRAKFLVKRGSSLRKAAEETGVPFNTIRDHLRYEQENKTDIVRGKNRELTDSEESDLANYATYMSERAFPITRKVLKKLVVDIIKSSGRQTSVNLESGPSDAWVRSFLERHPSLSLRTPHPLENSRAEANQSQINHYYKLLEHTLQTLGIENDPTRLYNLDETGFSGKEHSRDKVLVKKGVRTAYQQMVGISGHVTFQVAISASGKAFAPLVIFSKNLPRRNYSEGLPDEWSFVSTDSCYINSAIFLSWFQDCFVKQIGRSRPVVVIMDNHTSHLSTELIHYAKSENIELLCLPAHSTHLLQPLDVGYYHMFKTNVSNMATSLGYTGLKTIPRHKFPKLLHLALNKIAGSSISAAFSAVGIYPLNTTKVRLPDSVTKTNKKSTSVAVPEAKCTEGVCVSCGSNTENQLFKLGLISAELKNILVEPAKNNPKQTKRKSVEKARVITAEELNCIPLPVMKEPAEPRKKRARKGMPCAVVQDIPAPVVTIQDSQTLCQICLTGSNAFDWVSCDQCDDGWYHYPCLSSERQAEVDLSIVLKTPWLCNACRVEE